MLNKKSNLQLGIAIFAFVVFDFSTLAFNYLSTQQIEEDAVAINFAGRQRMRSQRITKALLLATNPALSTAEREAARKEAAETYALFQSTLEAFAEGGETIDSNGQAVPLSQATGHAASVVARTGGLISQWPSVPESESELKAFAAFMATHNLAILDSMNQLTNALEQQSVSGATRMRTGQFIAFGFSIANFLLILYFMFRAKRRALKESKTDPLTGLHNRAGLYQQLDVAIAEYKKSGTPLGVMLLDLDGFKEVNDTYGHAAGDETLREAAHRLISWQRLGWTSGRLGGDEFAVICPGLPPDQIAHIVSDLSSLLSGLPAKDLVVTASVGGASAKPGCDADSIMAKADMAMYAMKSAKRTSTPYRSAHRSSLGEGA